VYDDGGYSKIFWWTIPKSIIKNQNNGFDRNSLICLCRESSSDRRRFFQQIREKYNILTDINWRGIEDLLSIYNQQKFTIGITHSPHQGNYIRGMKAFRDWLGPATGSLLVYDNYPQIVKYLHGIVPTYEFNNAVSLLETIEGLTREQYDCLLLEQQSWLMQNTIDEQFISIFLEMGLI
jgi:hypothetical protein